MKKQIFQKKKAQDLNQVLNLRVLIRITIAYNHQ